MFEDQMWSYQMKAGTKGNIIESYFLFLILIRIESGKWHTALLDNIWETNIVHFVNDKESHFIIVNFEMDCNLICYWNEHGVLECFEGV